MTVPADRSGFAAVPHSYPALGLLPRSVVWRRRPNSTSAGLRRRLEAWERERGNRAFRAYNLERAPVDLAFEYANLYAWFRETFPDVTVDGIDFVAARSELGKAVGLAWAYGESAPKLRRLAATHAVAPDARSLAALADRHGDVEAAAEAASLPWARDITAAGHIALSEELARPRLWAALYATQRRVAESRARRGFDDPWDRLDVSRRGSYLLHELGHLVEAHIGSVGGFAALEPVYAALSECLFGFRPAVSSWRYHLGNYPTRWSHPGPYQGGPARARANRRALRPAIRDALTGYAATDRAELFAEAFLYAFGGDVYTRRRLAPFRQAVVVACR